MDVGVLITGGVGLVTTIISSWVSWLFARKKYNSEVDNTIIKNMQESLEFYEELSDDAAKRLDNVLDRNKYLEDEIEELRKQMLNLMTIVCTDLTCQIRKGDYEAILNRDLKHNNKKIKCYEQK